MADKIAAAGSISEATRQQKEIHYFWDEASFTSLGELDVEGWAVCAMGIETVAVHLDGERLGDAELGLSRLDVGLTFEAIPAARSAGFRFHQRLPGLAAGDHDVPLVVRNALGNEQSAIKRLNLVGAAPPAPADPQPGAGETQEFQFQLDSPRVVHGAAVEPVIGQLTLAGWVFSRSGVADVAVQLDGAPLGLADYGLTREDVNAAYPDRDGALRSGYAFHFPPDALDEGPHLVKLVVRSHNGEELVEDFRIAVEAMEGDSSSRFEQILPTLLPIVVDHVYRTALCRPADPGALSNYARLLTSGKMDLRVLVDTVYGSSEYQGIIGPASEGVRAAYRLLFEREPTQDEIYNHVQTFRHTCSTDDEAISVLRSGAARARFAIRPFKIEMDITNQCNIRCIMCPFSDPLYGSRKRKDLDKDTFLRWADEMFSWASQVGLMFGTEPTLNAHLLDFVKTAKDYRVPNVYFSTNAVSLTPALTGGLIEAGLDEMNVSLDAGTKETFERIRRKARWDKVIANLRSLRDQKAALDLSRPRLHMSFVLMRSNIKELPQFVEIAAEMGAVVLYLTHLVAFDGLDMAAESLGTNLDEYKDYIDRALSLARHHGIHAVLPRTRQARLDLTLSPRSHQDRKSNHLAQLDQAREAHGLPRRFARDEANSCCPFPWHFMAIEPDGAVSPCGWWHSGPPMGNLYTQSFEEIWLGEPRRNLRSQLVSRDLGANCSRCPAAGVGLSESSASFQSR